MSTDIATLLRESSSTVDVNRNQAEAALTFHEKENPEPFFIALSQALANETFEESVRQAAGLRLRVGLYSSDPILSAERTARWKAIPAPSRTLIKNTVLQSLSSASPSVRNITSLTLAKIAFLELDPSEPDALHWTELLPSLIGMLLNEAAPVGVRASCAQSIGYVMEALDEYTLSPLLEASVVAVLDAILASLTKPHPELQLGAMKALLHSLAFMTFIFTNAENTPRRNNIFEAILFMAGTPTVASETRETAMDTLVKVAEYFYAQLDAYMDKLAPFTAQTAVGSDETLAGKALDFWAEVAKQEAELLDDADFDEAAARAAGYKGFILQNTKVLVDLLTHVLVTAQGSDEEDGDEGLVETVHFTLQWVAKAAGRRGEILQYVLPFASANFASPELKKRDAAVMSLSLVQESCTEEGGGGGGGGATPQLLGVNKQVIPMLLARLAPGGGAGVAREESSIIRESIAFYLSEVATHHLHHFDSPALLMQTVDLLRQSLGDTPKVARMAAMALNNIFHNCKSASEEDGGHFYRPCGSLATIFTGEPLFKLLHALMTKAVTTSGTVSSECFFACETVLGGVFGDAGDTDISLNFLRAVLAPLQAPLTSANPALREVEKSRHESLLGLVYCVLQRACDLEEDATSPSDPRGGMKNGIMAVVQDIFKVLFSCVEKGLPEAWGALGLLFDHFLTEDLKASVLPSISAKLLDTLKNFGDEYSMGIALSAAGDIVRSLEAKTPAPLLRDFLQVVVAVLSSPHAARDLKPKALELIFDLSKGPKEVLLQPAIFPVILTNIMGAASTDISASDLDDEDMVEFVSALHESALFAWMGLLHMMWPQGREDGNPQAEGGMAMQYFMGGGGVGDIAKRLWTWAQEWQKWVAEGKGRKPSLEVCKKSVGLLGDIVMAFNLANVGPTLQPYYAPLAWLTEYTHSREMEEDDTEAMETTANHTRKTLRLQPLQ